MIYFLNFVNVILDVVKWLIIISAIMSWLIAFNVINRHNQVVWTIWDSLNKITEPIYRPIRSLLPRTGAIDFAPLVALIGILFIQMVLLPNLAAFFR
jgi:YggT family protein